MNRLHLGCGKAYLDGWTNVDLMSTVKADLYSDILRLPFPDGSFDLIYASHVLEHVHRHMVMATLQHWRGLLRVGGILRLAVPDFSAVCAHYNETHDLPALIGLLYGGQNHPLNQHHITFDTRTLYDALLKTGFKDVRSWDWRNTVHAEVDDYSQAYLPPFKKDGGRLMSLNIEATK